jgi:hypothetical protein
MKLQPGQLDRVEVDSLQSRARFRARDLRCDFQGCLLRRPDLLAPAAILSPEALKVIQEY